jgi:cytochrome c
VDLTSGASFKYAEFNLRFRTDGSEKGPAAASPVIIPSGMMGDRGFLIFARPAEISAFIKGKC